MKKRFLFLLALLCCVQISFASIQVRGRVFDKSTGRPMEYATVSFYNPSQGQVQFELYSLQGHLMQRITGVFDEGAQQFELSLQDLTKGFYLLRISHSNGWGQTVKVVVR